MRVTSKGQVTIPIEIRNQLDIGPDTEVEFKVVDNVIHLRKSEGSSQRGRRVIDRLLTAPYSGPSTNALMALTRGDP